MVTTVSTELYRQAGYADFLTVIEPAVQAYLNGYVACGGGGNGEYLFFLVGTNSGNTSSDTNVVGSSAGAAWAGLVNTLNAWVASPPSWSPIMEVDAAIDIEPEAGWAPPTAVKAWATSYDANTSWSYINFGTAECTESQSAFNNGCGDGTYAWTQEDIFLVSYGINAAFNMPEIYSRNGSQAAQWDGVSYYASNTQDPVHTQGSMFMYGATTENQACADFGGNQACYDNDLDNPPGHGWRQLYVLTYGDAYIPPNSPLGWSTDFTKRN